MICVKLIYNFTNRGHKTFQSTIKFVSVIKQKSRGAFLFLISFLAGLAGGAITQWTQTRRENNYGRKFSITSPQTRVWPHMLEPELPHSGAAQEICSKLFTALLKRSLHPLTPHHQPATILYFTYSLSFVIYLRPYSGLCPHFSHFRSFWGLGLGFGTLDLDLGLTILLYFIKLFLNDDIFNIRILYINLHIKWKNIFSNHNQIM